MELNNKHYKIICLLLVKILQLKYLPCITLILSDSESTNNNMYEDYILCIYYFEKLPKSDVQKLSKIFSYVSTWLHILQALPGKYSYHLNKDY